MHFWLADPPPVSRIVRPPDAMRISLFIILAMVAGCRSSDDPYMHDRVMQTPLEAGVPQWMVPARWQEIAPGPAMIKAYSPMPGSTKAIVVTVNHLPNVINRERPPLALPRIELTGDRSDGSRSTVPLPDANDHATMIDLRGRDPDTFAPRRLLVINVARTNEEWLYKLIGDTKAVDSQKDAFVKFVQSAHYP